MVGEELASLRSGREAQADRCRKVVEDLAAAQAEEERERSALLDSRDHQKERAKRLASKMQAVIRGWLVRKRIVFAMNSELEMQVGMAALLPDQLRDQLKQLQHSVHDLKYQPEHRERAVIRIQAALRSVMARRVVAVLRVGHKIEKLYRRMESSATRIAAWFKGTRTRVRFRFQIYMRMEQTRARQIEEMEQGILVIVRIQRIVRRRLAWKRMQEAREQRSLELGAEAREAAAAAEVVPEPEPLVLVDSWRPGGLAGDPLGDEAATIAAKLALQAEAGGAADQEEEEGSSPRQDRELERLEDEGLEPFYWSSSQELVRHRIGGPQALKMQSFLAIGEDWTPSADSEVDHMCGLWDVYPEGLTADFLDNLDKDAWPWKRRGRRRRENAPQPKATSEARLCVKAAPPPSNTERRAQARQEAAALAAACGNQGDVANCEAHPMFMNAPRSLPAPPEAPPLRRPPRARLAKYGGGAAVAADEDASWGGARSFAYCPRAGGENRPARGRTSKPGSGGAAAAFVDEDASWGGATSFTQSP